MLKKYNKLVKEWNELQHQMLVELKTCGFVEVLQEGKATGDYTKANALLDQMEDSPCKGHIKRKLKLDNPE